MRQATAIMDVAVLTGMYDVGGSAKIVLRRPDGRPQTEATSR